MRAVGVNPRFCRFFGQKGRFKLRFAPKWLFLCSNRILFVRKRLRSERKRLLFVTDRLLSERNRLLFARKRLRSGTERILSERKRLLSITVRLAAQTAGACPNVDELNLTVSNTYNRAEVQAIADKLDELLALLKRE